ncbi:MAG: DUF72 domain-containing protein, partial [Candidatus Nanoarchaeia archaeon]
VKCNQIVTHKDRFQTSDSIKFYRLSEDIAKALKSNIILLQTPSSFKPDEKNVKNLRTFFKKAKPSIKIAWEVRGGWWEKEKLIKEICEEFDIINCVDPFRNTPLYFGKSKIAYFRLHGFGKPSMYNYKFSDRELKRLKEIIDKLKAKYIYVFFNNFNMYEDAKRFENF